jgi:WxL Interacting Protein, peptidoglycan binding domain
VRRAGTTCLLLLAVLAPAAANAAAGGGFSIRPGHVEAGSPASRAYFDRTVAPGGTFSDDVVVANPSGSPITLLVYPVDGLTGQTTGSVYANRGQPLRRAGAWVTPASSSITVPAGTQLDVPFTVRVPSAATAGDHLAGIAFEEATAQVSTGSFRIRQVIREVIGVLVRVPGPAAPWLRVGTLALQTLPGSGLAAVQVPLANAGGALCKPRLAVSIVSRRGTERLVRQLDTVLPHDAVDYPFVLRHGLPPATYSLSATATCASSSAHAAAVVRTSGRLRGVDDVTARSTGARGQSREWFWAAAALAVLVAAGAGVAAGSRLPRARRAGA